VPLVERLREVDDAVVVIAFCCCSKHCRYLCQQCRLVFFHRQHVVRFLAYDLRRHILLAAHCVDGHCRSLQLQQVEQAWDRSYLIRFLVSLELAEYDGGGWTG
jgi:hypothetical protein